MLGNSRYQLRIEGGAARDGGEGTGMGAGWSNFQETQIIFIHFYDFLTLVCFSPVPPHPPFQPLPITIMKRRIFTPTHIRKTNGKIHLQHKSCISAWKHAQPMISDNRFQIQPTQNPLHFDLELIHFRFMTRIDYEIKTTIFKGILCVCVCVNVCACVFAYLISI